MLGITDLQQYLLGTIAIVLLPGPNSMFVLSVAARRGVRAGYAGAAGVFAGDAVLMLLTALGAASVLKAVPELFLVIKMVGAAYLTWVGLGLIRGAWLRWQGRAPAATSFSQAPGAPSAGSMNSKPSSPVYPVRAMKS